MYVRKQAVSRTGRPQGDVHQVGKITAAMVAAGNAVAAQYVDMEWEAIGERQRAMILREVFSAMAQAGGL